MAGEGNISSDPLFMDPEARRFPAEPWVALHRCRRSVRSRSSRRRRTGSTWGATNTCSSRYWFRWRLILMTKRGRRKGKGRGRGRGWDTGNGGNDRDAGEDPEHGGTGGNDHRADGMRQSGCSDHNGGCPISGSSCLGKKRIPSVRDSIGRSSVGPDGACPAEFDLRLDSIRQSGFFPIDLSLHSNESIVDPANGDDETGTGSPENPFKTLNHAIKAITGSRWFPVTVYAGRRNVFAKLKRRNLSALSLVIMNPSAAQAGDADSSGQ